MEGTLRAGCSKLTVRWCAHPRIDHSVYVCALITDCRIGEVAAVLSLQVFESYLASFEVVAASRHRSSTNNNSRIDRVDARVFLAGCFQYMSTLFTNAVPYLDSQKRFVRLELEGCRLYTFRDAADLV